MEIICRQCEGNAFRILPENLGTVTAECVVCGTLTLIEVPKAAARANGRRRDGFASEVMVEATRRKSAMGMN